MIARHLIQLLKAITSDYSALTYCVIVRNMIYNVFFRRMDDLDVGLCFLFATSKMRTILNPRIASSVIIDFYDFTLELSYSFFIIERFVYFHQDVKLHPCAFTTPHMNIYPTPGCENQWIRVVVSKAVDTTGPNLHIGYNTLICITVARERMCSWHSCHIWRL